MTTSVRFLLLALLALGLQECTRACDVSYTFDEESHGKLTTQMSVTLTWWQVTPMTMANVYLSTATNTGCNSGYFGAQFHSDGTQAVLFSMWDAPKHGDSSEFEFQGLPASPNCKRNALDSTGASTGVQCNPAQAGIKVNLELGVPYIFTLGMTAQNASGSMWEATMFDRKYSKTLSLGKMFFVDAPMGLDRTVCRRLGHPTTGLSAYSFMEYYMQPREYLTAATWSNMVVRGEGGVEVRPSGIAGECCDRGDLHHGDHVNCSSTTCLPPDCTSPSIHFTCGPHLEISESVQKQNPNCFPKPVPPSGYRRGSRVHASDPGPNVDPNPNPNPNPNLNPNPDPNLNPDPNPNPNPNPSQRPVRRFEETPAGKLS